jgi:DNA-binding LytR/AlgR family response regulator
VRLRAVVADDEAQARKRVARLLEELPDVEVIATCASAEEVLARLALAPQVLFLDISMPGIGGLALGRRLGAAGPAVVFVTAHGQHAVEAFDIGAIDYVMKPVTGARLAQAIARVRQRPVAAPGGTRIPIATRAGIALIEPRAIEYARFDGALVTLCSAVQSWISATTLKELEEQLPPSFVRADRRHLVNVDEITQLQPEADGGFVAVTRSGARVPVSRQAGRDLRRRLGL